MVEDDGILWGSKKEWNTASCHDKDVKEAKRKGLHAV